MASPLVKNLNRGGADLAEAKIAQQRAKLFKKFPSTIKELQEIARQHELAQEKNAR